MGGDPANHFVRGEVCIDVNQRIAEVSGTKVTLTAREWAVLEVLVRQPSAVIGRHVLEEKLYDFGAGIESNSIEVFISGIRKNLAATLSRPNAASGIEYKAHNDKKIRSISFRLFRSLILATLLLWLAKVIYVAFQAHHELAETFD